MKRQIKAKEAMKTAAELFTDSVTTCADMQVSEVDGCNQCKFTFVRAEKEFTNDDDGIFTELLINLGGFDDIVTLFDIPHKKMFVTCYYGGKPVKKVSKSNREGRKSTAEILEQATWAMKEMYDCLCGMYSEQGDGFASTFVKDEKKMMDTAEKSIIHMEALLSKINAVRRKSNKPDFALEA